MLTLDRKLLRELNQTKGQSIAIALVVASGVAVFVMALGTLGFLRSTRDAYYDRYRFADMFASVRRAPDSVVERVIALDGVSRVQSRIVSDVTLDVPRLAEPAIGRLISLPDHGAPVLNAVYLRRGRLPEPDRPGEVLANEVFVDANKLNVGDKIGAVLNGRRQELSIVGVGLSPEYVFQMRGGSILPDDRRFGVLWMAQRQMEAAFDMEGAFNDISLRLQPSTQHEEIIDRLNKILEPFGTPGAYDRDDQISAQFLDDEIQQLRATALVSPVIFLSVAAFLLNVVLSRRIGTQREIIATLKAFGYSNAEIAWHYLKSALIVSFTGALAGAIAGLWLGNQMAHRYSQFYRFPEFIYHPDYRVVLLGMGLSLLAAIVGAYRAVRETVKMLPAEAMRPASPTIFRPSLVERVGLTKYLPLTTRMILRRLQRRPFVALFSTFGISFSVAIVLMSGFLNDAFDYLIDFQFKQAQRQDVQVIFYQTTSPGAQFDLAHLPGVQSVEPFRAVPVLLQRQHYDYRTSILGLDEDRELYRLLDIHGTPTWLPPRGIVLSDKLANWLHAKVGDTIEIEILEGERPTRSVQVVGLAYEYAGMNAYMRRSALNVLMRETDALSGAYLSVDSLHQNELYDELKQTPQVASVAVKDATIDQFRDLVEKNQSTMQSFTLFFAAIIAVGVVYNTSRISLDERSRELATMRVIGFTRREVSTILLGELAVLTLLAIPLGWAIGYFFCASMVAGFESEVFRIPLVIHGRSYALAGIITITAATVSGLVVRRKLDSLDLVEVLKTRE